jgi:hypothetical protein
VQFQVGPDTSYPAVNDTVSQLITAGPNVVTVPLGNVATAASDGADSGTIMALSPDGTAFSDVANQVASTVGLPSGTVVLTGALTYTVHDVPVGGSITVALVLPAGSRPTGVFKYENGSYVDVSSTATITGNEITLQLTDGGPGDSDGVANGVIVDPVIPVEEGQDCSPPLITSSSAASAVVGVPFNSTVTTCSTSIPAIKASGLPKGLALVDHHDGTATVSGTPLTKDAAVYSATVTASVKGLAPSTQHLSITVDQAPAFKSKAAALVRTVDVPIIPIPITTAYGSPAPSITTSSTLPPGLHLVDNGNGQAALTGTPGATSGGVYPLSITATNSVISVMQAFVLTVYQSPSVAAPTSISVTDGTALVPLSIGYSGYPMPTVKAAGLPKGLTFVSHGNGSATIAGTPGIKDPTGTDTVTITASGKAGTQTQHLSVVVTAP